MTSNTKKSDILSKSALLGAGAALTFWGLAAAASGGIVGQCSDCHTMHNSEQGAPVAVKGLGSTVTATPIRNLLRMDCIACHARDAAGPRLALLPGGSTVPQVYHGDTTGDLAAGNFKHITAGTSRMGHNVSDLFAGGDDNGGMYGAPPGKYYASEHGQFFSSAVAAPFDKFTCAGAAGCHGTRANLMSGSTVYADTTDTVGTFAGERRQGIAAISGAHHNSRDGVKDAYQAAGGHSGQAIAASYRFIDGLKGTGSASRWQNVDSVVHNEYYGRMANATADGCDSCHVPGVQPGISPRMTFDSTLKVPNQSMSGFCITCHGNFHSSGLENGTSRDLGPSNGTSGAFLRHPSDYVIPAAGEYADYTLYTTTAPVARPTLYAAAESLVNPGTDLVMCLSCHMAHASPYEGMLRFDYTALTSGMRAGDGNSTHAGVGCLACHTAKGGPVTP